MAHIILRPNAPERGVTQLVINGHDFSHEVTRDVELVSVGDDEYAEVGFRVTFAVSRLDLGGDEDIVVTDHLRSVAQRVRSMVRDEVGESA
ncbi:MAG TPA: hypothetical protein VFO98_15510 [Marmoricola sp.]|nr:hypothetical protein [Marmoricola sp.]